MRILSYEVLADGVTGTLPQMGALIDTAALASGISLVVPLIVAFITKREASDRVKSVINLLSVAVASAIAFILRGGDGQPVTWKSVLAVFVAALTTSIVAYKAAWKPLNTTKAIADATPRFGVGTPVPAVAETERPGRKGKL